MLRGSPDSAPIILPFWAQTLDAKGMDKMAQAFAATAPPEVRAIIQPDSQQSTEQLKSENEKLKQGLQEAIQHAHDADDEAQQAKDELQKVQADTEAKKQEVAIKGRESQVKIATTLDEQKIRHRELQLEEAKVALTAKQHLDNKEQTDKQMERDDAKEEANKSDPEQDDQMEEALTKVVEQVVQEQTKTSKAIDSLMQAQQQNQELMKTLIKAVQAPRIKEIKYDKNGDPIGSTERIETLQ
jgi:hypothetical protein